MAIIRVKYLDDRDFLVVPEAKTLGIIYGLGFRTAASVFRNRVSTMLGTNNQYEYVWR